LADGKITEQQAELIRTACLADGKVDKEEVEFLAELKRDAESVHPQFDEFFFSVMKRVVLVDGVIDDSEAVWLRRLITNDHQILPSEVRFIKELKREARKCGPAFEKLHNECLGLGDADFHG
jgi:uncharacterized tellurite resistance protein B-like protein